MKKRTISLILILCLFWGAIPLSAGAQFNDIHDSDVAVAAAVLQSMGIVTGISENIFSPDTLLTRAQFCALAVRAMGLEDKEAAHSYKALFTDVKPGSWYTGYVNLAYSEGIVAGYGNGTFGPEDSITYGQAATLLLRVLGYTANEIGNLWPSDYVSFSDNLGLADGVTVTAYAPVTRGQASILLYNTLKTEINGSSSLYYQTVGGIASSETVIILDTDSESGGTGGLLMACGIGVSTASIQYYGQKNTISSVLEGYIGTLLLNGAGKVVGFMPASTEFVDLTVSSATASFITSSSGLTYRISAGATVIYSSDLYDYATSGYLKVDGQKGRSVRLYYDDDDAIKYVYISSGSSGGSDSAVAETNSSESELARKLGITGTGYTITKNGSPASSADLARYDVAYYDRPSRTMHASDYKITGYITAASPSVGAAKSITVAGCELEVLEAAWDTLSPFSLGSNVTLLLTDDNRVAAAFSPSTATADMIGILSSDGKGVTLAGSGLVLSASTVTASTELRGGLVKVSASSKTQLRCTSLSPVAARVDIDAETVGSYELAPACDIYEWTGNGGVYSLSGERGIASKDFDEIFWTSSLDSSRVSWYRLNSAGKVDALLLRDVTGNCYEYGKIELYTDAQGINLGSSGWPAYNNAVAVTNSGNPSGSSKYLCVSGKAGYGGISLSSYSETYMRASMILLIKAGSPAPGDFFQSDGKWYITVDGYEIPVSDSLQVYVQPAENWLAGESGLTSAIASGMTLTAYYDRPPSSGGRIRLITLTA